MTESHADEMHLRTVLLQELAVYERALEAAHCLAEAVQRGESGAAEVQGLVALLDEVAALERSIADAKRQRRQAGVPPGSDLHAVMDRVAGTIQKLAGVVKDAETALARHRDQLLPAVDAMIRARRMQRAYGARSRRDLRSG